MAKSFSLSTIAEKNSVASSTPFLILLDIEFVDHISGNIVDTEKVVRNNEDVVFNGQTYTALPFELTLKHKSGEIPDLSISFEDHAKLLDNYMRLYSGCVGSNVNITLVNADRLNEPPEHVEYFKVVGANTNNYSVTWKLGAENPLASAFPRRRQMRDRCAWRYKSSECGYVGAITTCDQSLTGANGCEVHANSINFGGFPGIRPTDGTYR